MTPAEMVLQFHETFDCARPGRHVPRLDPVVAESRRRIFDEEMREYVDACEAEDIVEVADAIGDMIYVLYGHAIAHGIRNMDEILAEIHRSNMTKLGADGLPIWNEHGKVVKGPNFERPNIGALL